MGLTSMILGYILNYLENHKDLKAKIVQKLNENVDIPMLSEETEAKVFDALFESVKDALHQAAK